MPICSPSISALISIFKSSFLSFAKLALVSPACASNLSSTVFAIFFASLGLFKRVKVLFNVGGKSSFNCNDLNISSIFPFLIASTILNAG